MERANPDLDWLPPPKKVEVIGEDGPQLGYSIARMPGGGEPEFFEAIARKWHGVSYRFVKGIRQMISPGTIYRDYDSACEVAKDVDDTGTWRIIAVLPQDHEREEPEPRGRF